MDEKTTGPAIEPQPNGSAKVKTIKVKHLLQVILLIIFVAAAVFGTLYYIASVNHFFDGGLDDDGRPRFLFNVYEGNNSFSHPIAVTVDKKGRIYVSNNELHTVEVLSPIGKPVLTIGGPGQGQGQFFYPYGLGFTSNGQLMAAETGNYRIQLFEGTGNYAGTFLGQQNKSGLEKPGPICIDSRGRVYVGDISGHQVLVFNAKGQLLRRITDIMYPHGIAVDETANTLYVSDSQLVGIKVFNLDDNENRPAKTITNWQSDKRFSMVRGLAVDKTGRLYVADTISCMVRVFDREGRYLFSIGSQGFEDGQFLYPNGLFIDSKNRLYVADWGNNRLSVWAYK